MSETPSTNGESNGEGRDGSGRFVVGNKLSKGNPHASDVGRARAAFFAAVKDDDAEKCLETCRQIRDDASARPADRLAAAREILDRLMGKPTQPVVAAGEVKFHPITLDGDVDLSEFEDEELMKFERVFSGRTSARLPDMQPPAMPAEGS